MQLNPELYQQECDRVTARFEEAVHLTEQAFTEELAKLVEHLSDRLSGQSDGKPKIFRNSAIDNLTAFFERFRQLNISSSAQLDELVDRAQQIVQGVPPQTLRDNQVLRQTVAAELSEVRTVLEDLLIDRPRRNILRRRSRQLPQQPGGIGHVRFDRPAASLNEAIASAVADLRSCGLDVERIEIEPEDLQKIVQATA